MTLAKVQHAVLIEQAEKEGQFWTQALEVQELDSNSVPAQPYNCTCSVWVFSSMQWEL
jgi:hypothetical protein